MPSQCRTRIAAFTALAVIVLLVHGAARADEQAPQVRVTTNMGEFVIEVRPERAPLTTTNFLRYVREGFYSGTLIHRVVPNFVIQGGGHDAATMKLKPTRDNVVNEAGNGLQNKRGAVGLARGDSPHSGNAQFYVNIADNPDLDPVATRWGYAVFGRVVDGMDVVDRIGAVATGTVGPFKSDAPLKPIVIEKIEEIVSSAPAPAPPAPAAAATTGPQAPPAPPAPRPAAPA